MHFFNLDGSFSKECMYYYNNILKYVNRYNLENTKVALDLAIKLHSDMYRDGGAPYIIHPMEIANYLILLNIRNPILDMNLSNLHDEKLAETNTNLDIDILLASALLHDTIEDCEKKLPNGRQSLITEYQLHQDVFKYVITLTKDKHKEGYTIESYYEGICSYWQTLILKVADRTSNCSTIDAFKENRIEKYIRETKKFFYPMISKGKNLYPDFSRILTVMKYLIVSICESVASILHIDNIIVDENYEKTFFFIKGFAIGKDSMQNTLRALPLCKEYYKGFTRKSGDNFIIHPLRVCSYLISMKIDNDVMCASALLHEIIKKCHLEYNGIEIITKYNLDPKVLEYIRLMANVERYPLDLYYMSLCKQPEVFLLKLSNRAHTCTSLIDASDAEITEYVDECEKYIYPSCKYVVEHYPEYHNTVYIMKYHISSVCSIVKSLRHIS